MENCFHLKFVLSKKKYLVYAEGSWNFCPDDRVKYIVVRRDCFRWMNPTFLCQGGLPEDGEVFQFEAIIPLKQISERLTESNHIMYWGELGFISQSQFLEQVYYFRDRSLERTPCCDTGDLSCSCMQIQPGNLEGFDLQVLKQVNVDHCGD